VKPHQLSLGIETEERRAFVPRDWLTSPLFLAGEQPHGRTVEIRGATWTLGVPNPFQPQQPSSRINFNHVRLLIALLSLRFPGQPTIPASIRQICSAYGSGYGQPQRRQIKAMINDLRNFWVRVTMDGGARSLEFSLIHSAALEKEVTESQGEVKVREFLDDLRLHPHFMEILADVARVLHVRVDVVNSLPTDTARALYLFIPSRAVNYGSGDRAWTIRARTLLGQVGVEVPPNQPSVLRRRLSTSVEPLDGVPLLGPTLRSRIVYDRKDNPQVLFWVERSSRQRSFADSVLERRGVLVNLLTEAGWTDEQIRARLNRHAPLPDHLVTRLTRSGIDPVSNRVFLELACCILGEARFEYICSELFQSVIEGTLNGSASAILNHRLQAAIGSLAAPSR
jgi:hypothetical protein